MNLLASLRYLVALQEHRHFGRAAQSCHITQPALSNAIRALEREFNVVIVKRDRNFAGLTPQGERVLASAQLMLHEHANLQQELQSETLAPRGPVRKKSALLSVRQSASAGTSISPPTRSGAAGEKPSQSHPRLITLPSVLTARPR